MSHYDAFEQQLATALRDYVADAPVDVDPRALAHAVATAHPRRTTLPLLFAARRSLVWLLLAGLLILAMAAAFFAAQRPFTGGRGMLAFERDGNVYLAEPDGSRIVYAFEHDRAWSLGGWSPDGRRLAMTSEGQVHQLDVTTLELRALTGQDDYVEFLGWAPDGRSILVRHGFGPECCGVRIVDVETGSTRELAGRDLCMPVWSPDGRSIAAVASTGVVVIDIATGDSVGLGRFGGFGCDWSTGWDAPTWSPDSERVAFVKEPRSLVVAGRAGGDVARIARTDIDWPRPLWSPDGEWIAYRRSDGLGLIRPDGTGARLLVEGEVDSRRFAWTADSAGIDFARAVDGALEPAELWTVDVSSGELERISAAAPNVDSFARQPSSPDRPARALPNAVPTTAAESPMAPSTPERGSPADPAGIAAGIAFDTSWMRPNAALPECQAIVAWFGGEPFTRFEVGCPHTGTVPGWSPDGSLYGGHVLPVGVLRRDGSELAILADSVGVDFVQWSAGGAWLALIDCQTPTLSGATECAGDVRYRVVRPDGSGLRDVDGLPSWSPRDERLAVAASDGRLLIGAADGSDLRSIGSFPPIAAWASDASRFAYILDGDVWVADVDGTGARNVSRLGPGAGVSVVSWSPEGAHIAVTHGKALWVMSVDGTERRRITVEGFDPSFTGFGIGDRRAPAWAPDGRHLAIEGSGGPDGTDVNVVIVDTTTWRPVLLTDAAMPVWSPDGTFLAIRGDGIEITRADGSGRHSVTTGLGFDVEPLSEHRWVP